jgi:serine/threonine protein kinase
MFVNDLILVTEYVNLGSLDKFLKTDVKITQSIIGDMAKDIAAGMVHLHAEGTYQNWMSSLTPQKELFTETWQVLIQSD